jgi:hypothetical protein
MSVPEDPFDFATLLRREAVRNERPANNQGLAPAVSEPPLQPAGSQRAAVTHLADSLAPDPVPHPTDATGRHRNIAAPTATFSAAYKRLTTLWPSSLRLSRAPDAPLFGIVSGGAAFVLIVGTIIVSLVQHVVPRTSGAPTDSSGALKLASVNPQRTEPPAMQASAPALGSSSAIAPASLRDIADPESKIHGSSEANPPESVAVVPASVRTLASPETASPSEMPKLAAMYSQPVATQPIPLPPIPPAPLAAQRSALRAATETTASISPSAPSSETAAALPRAEATQPQGDNASRRKRDQRPGTAGETPVPPVSPPLPAQRGASPSRAATEVTASISPTAPSSETKAALPRAEATQPRIDGAAQRKRDQKQGTVGETPIPSVPPAAQRGTSPSRAATETTASISPSAPSSETKAAPRADATQPHIDDASQRKRDQKPGNAGETSSCTADVIPGYVRASPRAKSGQVDVQKLCADPNVPFTVSVRCLVAAVVCSDYPAEKQGRVAQKATAANRAPSHPATDTKADTKADAKPDAKPQ